VIHLRDASVNQALDEESAEDFAQGVQNGRAVRLAYISQV